MRRANPWACGPVRPASVPRDGLVLPPLRRTFDLHEGPTVVGVDTFPAVILPDGRPARPHPREAIRRADVLGPTVVPLGPGVAKGLREGHAHVAERAEVGQVIAAPLGRDAPARTGITTKGGRIAVHGPPLLEVPSPGDQAPAAGAIRPAPPSVNAMDGAINARRASAGVLNPASSGGADGRDTGP